MQMIKVYVSAQDAFLAKEGHRFLARGIGNNSTCFEMDIPLDSIVETNGSNLYIELPKPYLAPAIIRDGKGGYMRETTPPASTLQWKSAHDNYKPDLDQLKHVRGEE